VDGVPTLVNNTPTGLTQLPNCKNFTGDVKSFEVCRAWWQKQREYTCVEPQQQIDLARFSKIKDTINVSGTSFAFTDLRKGSTGAWTAASMQGVLPQGDTYGLCMPTCKVKRAGQLTQVGLSGSVSANLVDNSTFETRYLPCEEDNVCPAEPGDIIEMQCGCIDEFPLAASIMQTMRLSGADSICSDGTPKAP